MTPGRIPPLDFAALAGPVALALFGEPNRRLSTAAEWRYGGNGSLAVRLDSGTWFDFEAGDGGGVLDLAARELGGDRASAARWLESSGFATGTAPRAHERRPELRAGHWAGGSESPSGTRAHNGTYRAAQRVWRSTRPLSGTVAEHYLTARGVGHVVGAPALRFHPAARHPTNGKHPAMVALVRDLVTGRGLGVQRTFLRADGTDKANLDPLRAALGAIRGGAVRLGEPGAGRVLVGEGIESTAAAMRVLDVPAGWAALGTSGLRAVELPESVRRMVIAADRDAGGLRAAAALAERLEAEGRQVTIEAPPCGDFADWQGERA